MDNRASRPLSHTEAMCRPVSSWVGDYQRITAVDCFCLFAFPFPSLDNEIVIARHKDPYGGPRIIAVFYSGTPGGLNPYFPGKVQALIGSSQGQFLSTNHTAQVIPQTFASRQKLLQTVLACPSSSRSTSSMSSTLRG
jgi:hypothetical protein